MNYMKINSSELESTNKSMTEPPISRENRTENRRAFIINALYVAVVAAIFYVVFKFFLPWVLPFVIGLIISLILMIPIKLLSKHTRLPKKLIKAGVLILGYGVIVTLIILLGARLFDSISAVFSGLPEFYSKNVQPSIVNLNDKIVEFVNKFSSDSVESTDSMLIKMLNDIQRYIASFSSTAVSYIGSITKRLPLFLVGFIFTIMFSVLITMNYEDVIKFIKKQIPEKHERLVYSIKANGIDAVGKYFKAYLIILTITFIELSIGLTILGVKNSVVIAFGISIFDILPFLGTGGIVIPWAILSLINGNAFLGIGLLIVYAIITIIRNIIEPRIVGDQLGLNPIVALICMYLGLRTMGILGMILVPITAQIVIRLNDEGLIKVWKK